MYHRCAVFCNGGAGGLKGGVPSPSAALRRLLSHAEILKLCVPVVFGIFTRDGLWEYSGALLDPLPGRGIICCSGRAITVLGCGINPHIEALTFPLEGVVSSQPRLWTYLRVAQRGPFFFVSEAPSISFPGWTAWFKVLLSPGHRTGVFLHVERGSREGSPFFPKQKTRAGSGIRKAGRDKSS